MDLNVVLDIALAENRNWGFKDQLFRAALSVCNNLAEGYETPTTAHQLRYLWIAKGSNNEVCSMLLLAKRRGYFQERDLEQMLSLQDEAGRLIRSYIQKKTGIGVRCPERSGYSSFGPTSPTPLWQNSFRSEALPRVSGGST